MKKLKITELGPIKDANITFGDLTIFVGPQASGKSILLQLIKLLIDKKKIRTTTEQYGFVWGNDEKEILNRYFGEGMSGIWNSATHIEFDHKAYNLKYLLPNRQDLFSRLEGDQLFYIPAQRIVSLQNGWPRFFTDYEDSVPYILREFSETLRLFCEENLITENSSFFSQKDGLKSELKFSFDNSIFHGGKIVTESKGKKRFKLEMENSSIPFMVWSAGQKEFMPLLLSFYYLCPPSRPSKRHHIKYVIIEEPEMGLHPQAIQSVLLQVLDLMSRGYQVVISTHSPVVLEFAWSLGHLKKNNAGYKSLAKLFELNSVSTSAKNMLNLALKSKIKTYFFERIQSKVTVKDISSLDAGSNDEFVSEWGGLATFNSKAIDIVSNSYPHDES